LLNITPKPFLVLTLLIVAFGALHAQVKIGDNYQDVSPYALLELESKDKALLLPRMNDAERDAAFGQEAPVGVVIFNTDSQVIQFLQYEKDKLTGRYTDRKVWMDVEDQQIYTDDPPAKPEMGDLFYDSKNNQMLVWDAEDLAWIPVGIEGANGFVEVIRGIGSPNLLEGLTNPKNNPPGMLYADTSKGRLYMAVDEDGDGVTDRWTVLIGGGSGGGGSQGPAGPQGPAGVGVLSGTGAPGATTAAPGSVYVDQSTGAVYTRTSNNTWVQGTGGDNLGNHTLTENLDLARFSLEDSSGRTGTVGQVLVRTASGTLWQNFAGTSSTSPTADGGITITSGNKIGLGGSLTRSTTLATSAANTLAITGLQSATDLSNHSVLVADKNTGILRTVSFGGTLQGAEVVYTATANQRVFATPLSIVDLKKYKLSVYRNGVRIDYTKNSNTAIEVVLDGVLAGCHRGDEIRIVQFN